MKLFVGAKGLVVHNGKVLLLRESKEYEEGVEEGKWDVPGGRIEPHETVKEGLLREIREESSLSVTSKQILGVFDGFTEIRGEKCHVVRIYFLCESDSDTVVLSKDHDAYAWINPKEQIEQILVNDIAEIIEVYNKKS